MDKYKASIYAFAYTKLRDFRDAEDVTQDVFIKAYRKLHTLRQWDSALSWLYSITNNQCKNLIRSQSKRPDREFIEDQDSEALIKQPMDSHRENTALESIREALDSLPDIYRQVLTLHYFGGMTCKEIAAFLRTSPNAIKKRLSRARLQLKEETLSMMGTTYSQQKLSAAFTFRIVETVKRIKTNPMPQARWLPWGLSLGTGIILTIISFYPQLFPIINPMAPPSEAEAYSITAIPVNAVKAPEISISASHQGSGKNRGVSLSDSQDTVLLALENKSGGWAKKTDMPTGRGHLSSVAVNGKIYAIGGTTYSGMGIPTVEEYDPITDRWTEKANMPGGRRGLSTCAVNGKIYAIGGHSDGITFSVVEEYDPVTDRWTRKADMPDARVYLSTSVVNGKIYAIGGAEHWGPPFLSTVEEYDTVTDKWTKKADMPTARAALSTSVVNGRIYAIGGTYLKHGTNDYNGLSVVEEYDPVTDKWTKKADMPTARLSLSTSVVNGKIHTIGGANRRTVFPSVEEYDPVTDKWTKKPDMLIPRVALSTSAVNGKIYAIGGTSRTAPAFLSSVEEYTAEESPADNEEE